MFKTIQVFTQQYRLTCFVCNVKDFRPEVTLKEPTSDCYLLLMVTRNAKWTAAIILSLKGTECEMVLFLNLHYNWYRKSIYMKMFLLRLRLVLVALTVALKLWVTFVFLMFAKLFLPCASCPGRSWCRKVGRHRCLCTSTAGQLHWSLEHSRWTLKSKKSCVTYCFKLFIVF